MTSSYFKTDTFNLRRYKDNHGKWYSLHVNKRPRGKVWMQLDRLEHRAAGNRLTRMVAECEQLIKKMGK